MVVSPEAEGGAGDDGEQGHEQHHAACDHSTPSLFLLRLLQLQPFQVAELTTLADEAGHAAATSQRKASSNDSSEQQRAEVLAGVKGQPTMKYVRVNEIKSSSHWCVFF